MVVEQKSVPKQKVDIKVEVIPNNPAFYICRGDDEFIRRVDEKDFKYEDLRDLKLVQNMDGLYGYASMTYAKYHNVGTDGKSDDAVKKVDIVIQCQYDSVEKAEQALKSLRGAFSTNFDIVRKKKLEDGEYIYISELNDDGVALVQNKNKKWGIINRYGEVAVECEHDSAEAVVNYANKFKGGRKVSYNEKLRVITEFNDGTKYVVEDGAYKLIDKTGEPFTKTINMEYLFKNGYTREPIPIDDGVIMESTSIDGITTLTNVNTGMRAICDYYGILLCLYDPKDEDSLRDKTWLNESWIPVYENGAYFHHIRENGVDKILTYEDYSAVRAILVENSEKKRLAFNKERAEIAKKRAEEAKKRGDRLSMAMNIINGNIVPDKDAISEGEHKKA